MFVDFHNEHGKFPKRVGWNIPQANNLEVQCRSISDGGTIKLHRGHTRNGATARSNDVRVLANIGLNDDSIRLNEEQLTRVVQHVGRYSTFRDVDTARIVVLPRRLTRRRVDIKTAIKHAQRRRVRSRNKFNNIPSHDSYQVALENRTCLVIRNLVTVLLLGSSRRQIAERTKTKGFICIRHLFNPLKSYSLATLGPPNETRD